MDIPKITENNLIPFKDLDKEDLIEIKPHDFAASNITLSAEADMQYHPYFTKLKSARDGFYQNPEKFFKIVAQQTNLNRLYYMWQNFLDIVKALIQLKRPKTFALNQNCVACAETLDKTLAAYKDVKNMQNCPLYTCQTRQAKNLRESDTTTLITKKTILELLREKIPTHNRAIISVPVKNRSYNHAMNYIRFDHQKDYVLCGQTGKVYDFTNQKDIALFNRKYNELDRFLQYKITGAAPW